jgi:hypothetical protein
MHGDSSSPTFTRIHRLGPASSQASHLLRHLQLEVRVLQRLLDRDPLRRIKRQQPPHEVRKLLVHHIRWRYDIRQRPTRPHVLLALPARFGLGPIQPCALLEELRLAPRRRPRKPLRHPTHHDFHHREVLEIVVRLVERQSGVEFYQDAAQTEGVAGEGPAQSKDDFGRTVVSGRDDGGVVFVLEGGGAKVDESDIGAVEDTFELGWSVALGKVSDSPDEQRKGHLPFQERRQVFDGSRYARGEYFPV